MADTVDKVANVWTKFSNPLRYLNNVQIENMLNNARYGDDVKLQVAYYEIEKATPIFSACINKRISGVLERNWDIVPIVPSEAARAQAEYVKKIFDDADDQVEDNLTDAIRHLVLASFRGRSAVKPFMKDGKLVFKKIDNWNFVRYNGINYWNPSSEATFLLDDSKVQNGNLPEIPRDEMCYVVEDKPLDYIGLTIYLRQLIGEENWARLIEKQGIPQVIMTVPEGTPETDLEKWNYRSQAIYEGGSGSLPFGSTVTQLTSARDQDPFTAYITHQSELFCILATGGALNTLAGTQGSSGTGMGSDTAKQQTDQFNSLVNYDCKRIQNAMSVAVKRVLGDAEVLCRFEYVEKDDTTPKEYLELAAQCKNMGITVDISKLKELTGLQFIQEGQTDLWTPERTESDEEK